MCSSFYLFPCNLFLFLCISLFPSFPESYFPLQNPDRSSVVLLRFSTSILLESVIPGDPLCQLLNSYLSYAVYLGYLVLCRWCFWWVSFNKIMGKVAPLQGRDLDGALLFADEGPRCAVGLGRMILWFQRPRLSHSLAIRKRQSLGPAVEQCHGQHGKLSDIFQPKREGSQSGMG